MKTMRFSFLLLLLAVAIGAILVGNDNLAIRHSGVSLLTFGVLTIAYLLYAREPHDNLEDGEGEEGE